MLQILVLKTIFYFSLGCLSFGNLSSFCVFSVEIKNYWTGFPQLGFVWYILNDGGVCLGGRCRVNCHALICITVHAIHDFLLLNTNLDTWLEMELVRSLRCKVTLFSLFFLSVIEKKSYKHLIKEWGVICHHFKVEWT